ncbi:hypothetical protein L6164_006051 [Bauhinia variegata]|uniref:Uncharacterized protein n=1 Tax=Bauhinia variegata TaxID=167791 RepID=A0ACB9PV20_BAUVA|nr:hypothetical protein L6164_006051 [Bauhinia variegata]
MVASGRRALNTVFFKGSDPNNMNSTEPIRRYMYIYKDSEKRDLVEHRESTAKRSLKLCESPRLRGSLLRC